MATAPTYRQMWPIYARYWDRMKIKANRQAEVDSACNKLLAHKARYLACEEFTGVPWHMIAVLHMRESGARFDRQLGQGDPLNRPSVNEPKGRGPFLTFEESAYDALVVLKRYNTVPDWRLEKILYWCERWNGWGYWLYHENMPSPFIWGATSIQKIGKYVADNTWDPDVWDSQLGCAPMLKVLEQINQPVPGTIEYMRET